MRIVRLAAVVLFVHGLIGQTFRGSIAGVVTDASGAAIAGAGVKLDSHGFGPIFCIYVMRLFIVLSV